MAVTYDLTATGDFLTVSRIRAYINDKVEGSGPLPGSENFQDAELLMFYRDEGNHIRRAVCAALEALAAAWAEYAGAHELGPESEAFKQSEAYASRAMRGREVFGYYKTDDDIPGSGRGVSIESLPPGF